MSATPSCTSFSWTSPPDTSEPPGNRSIFSVPPEASAALATRAGAEIALFTVVAGRNEEYFSVTTSCAAAGAAISAVAMAIFFSIDMVFPCGFFYLR